MEEPVEITVFDRTPMQVLAIVAELRDAGYRQRHDYEFFYHPAEYSTDWGWQPKRTVFVFYSSDLATWFTLKYVNAL